MRIIKDIFVPEKTKVVNYRGWALVVPNWVSYLAVNMCGVLKGHVEHVRVNGHDLHWSTSGNQRFVDVARVDLEGEDWKDSLEEVWRQA